MPDGQAPRFQPGDLTLHRHETGEFLVAVVVEVLDGGRYLIKIKFLPDGIPSQAVGHLDQLQAAVAEAYPAIDFTNPFPVDGSSLVGFRPAHREDYP